MSHARDLLVRFVLVGLFIVGLGAPPGEAQGVIKIGNLVDLTGPTSNQPAGPGQDSPSMRCSTSTSGVASTARRSS